MLFLYPKTTHWRIIARLPTRAKLPIKKRNSPRPANRAGFDLERKARRDKSMIWRLIEEIALLLFSTCCRARNGRRSAWMCGHDKHETQPRKSAIISFQQKCERPGEATMAEANATVSPAMLAARLDRLPFPFWHIRVPLYRRNLSDPHPRLRVERRRAWQRVAAASGPIVIAYLSTGAARTRCSRISASWHSSVRQSLCASLSRSRTVRSKWYRRARSNERTNGKVHARPIPRARSPMTAPRSVHVRGHSLG
jgi:hypothetical protein